MVDIAVIGLGAIGAAASYYLARAGANIVGFDQFKPPHDRGSSYGETRLVRVSYAEGESYVPLALRAVELWSELNADTGQTLFHENGVLYAGPEGGSLIDGVTRSANRHGLALEARASMPSFEIPDGWSVLFEPHAGFARPELAIGAWLDGAKHAGADLRTSTKIDQIERRSGRWIVQFGSNQIEAERILIAAGGWASQLRRSLAPLLSIERRVHTWFSPGDTALADADFPAFAVQDDLESSWFYGAPQLPGGRGVKLSPHDGVSPQAGPDQIDRQLHATDREPSAQFAARFVPGLGPVVDQEVCFYTMSPDEHFIIENALASEGVMTITGLSGHGFKFAPSLGEHAARCLMGRDPLIDLSGFSPDRF